jgi:hypothetical protein
MFLVPAASFDNVKGKFPIGFFVWKTGEEEKIKNYIADVFNGKGEHQGKKIIHNYDNKKLVIAWMRLFFDKESPRLSFMHMKNTDIQHQAHIFITGQISESAFENKTFTHITQNNVIETAIYTAIRHVIPATWLNDRDQYLYPHDSWKEDRRFQTDCLAYTLFSNNIQAEHGVNHWIPFTPHEVGAKEDFASHFMTDYMRGKIKPAKMEQGSLLAPAHSSIPTAPLEFSPEAKAVFDAGRKVWAYYHTKPDAVTDAALYDIKEYFQGRDKSGKMNTTSDDPTYSALMADLRSALKILAEAIEPKVYQHGFLLR